MTHIYSTLFKNLQKIMVEEGITRLTVHGLIGSSEKEREFALRLLLVFSSDEDFCVKIASGKGALVFLTSMADDLENRSLSQLAGEVLKCIERVDSNIEQLAVAGRFGPLLKRLREGMSSIIVLKRVVISWQAYLSHGVAA